ncbi:MAG: mannose-1-phosphate guanylyltransferase [Clostridia bacterium]|nr:mannose-1-phosphate guanylyltransferase [Clostridia bacterium]
METAVLILAGGSGIRLWPLSRKDKPKQFLPVLNNTLSFYQATLQRALKITDSSHIFVLTQQIYSEFIAEQSPQIPAENIFYENHKRNTAPAIAVAMMKVKTLSADSVSIVMPADHYIADDNSFLKTVCTAVDVAKNNNNIITIGITPTRPDTGFGYIKIDYETENSFFRVDNFKEKPDYQKALEFISDGNYLWNSGIFICKTSFMLKQFQKYLPDVFGIAETICNNFDSPKMDDLYSLMPDISIDYGILEKTNDILVIKGLFGWDDIGSWSAIERLYPADENQNIINGDCLTVNSKNCTVISNGKLTVMAGTEDLTVINTSDVTLIYSKKSTDFLSSLPSFIDEKGFKKLL